MTTTEQRLISQLQDRQSDIARAMTLLHKLSFSVSDHQTTLETIKNGTIVSHVDFGSLADTAEGYAIALWEAIKTLQSDDGKIQYQIDELARHVDPTEEPDNGDTSKPDSSSSNPVKGVALAHLREYQRNGDNLIRRAFDMPKE